MVNLSAWARGAPGRAVKVTVKLKSTPTADEREQMKRETTALYRRMYNAWPELHGYRVDDADA